MTTAEQPAHDSPPALGVGSALAMDALLPSARNTNPRMKLRQAEYETAVRSLKPGGDAIIFPVGSGKGEGSRSIKLRISYAIKRANLKDVTIGDATLKSSGKPVVYAIIKQSKPTK